MATHLAGNILEVAVKLAPIPYLDISFSLLTAINTSIKHVRGIRAQMTALATSVAELLYDLNTELQDMDHLDDSIRSLLENFNSLLTDVSETAQEYRKHSYLKIFFARTDVQNLIDQHHRKITQMSSNFQMRLQMTIHNDIRKIEENTQKIEEARQKDHKELLSVIERRFSQAADEAMKGEFPLTAKDIEDYSSTVHVGTNERKIVDEMLKCLDRSPSSVPSQHQRSNNTRPSPEQYNPNQPLSEEPVSMSAAESQMYFNRPYSARGPSPPAYTPYSARAAPYAPRAWNTYANDSQPYNQFGVGNVPMPIPHHYSTTAY